MTPCRILGVLSSGVGTGCSRVKEVFHSGSPIEKTFAPIIQSARYARRYTKTLETKTDSAMTTSIRDVARVTRCHVHLVKNGNGISLSVNSVYVIERGSENTRAVSRKEGS